MKGFGRTKVGRGHLTIVGRPCEWRIGMKRLVGFGKDNVGQSHFTRSWIGLCGNLLNIISVCQGKSNITVLGFVTQITFVDIVN